MVREATAADFETLWSIDQECFVEGIFYSQAELRHYMKRPRAFTLVKEDEQGIAAFVVAESSKRGTGHLITIDVRRRARRSGYGSELLHDAEDRLRTSGCDAVLLEVAVNNHSAIRFYKHHDYAVIKTIPRYYLDSVDALLMGKSMAVGK